MLRADASTDATPGPGDHRDAACEVESHGSPVDQTNSVRSNRFRSASSSATSDAGDTGASRNPTMPSTRLPSSTANGRTGRRCARAAPGRPPRRSAPWPGRGDGCEAVRRCASSGCGGDLRTRLRFDEIPRLVRERLAVVLDERCEEAHVMAVRKLALPAPRGSGTRSTHEGRRGPRSAMRRARRSRSRGRRYSKTARMSVSLSPKW